MASRNPSGGSPADSSAPRLVDIARLANVHPSVVSRVLNSEPTLSARPETRRRILKLAAELGYKPNAVARGLKTATTGAVGMIVPSLRNPLWAEVVRGVLAAATVSGFVVLIAEVPDAEDSGNYARLLDQGRVDGLLLVSSNPHTTADLDSGALPIVHVDRGFGSSAPNVVLDEAAAVALVSEHLRRLGHRHIVHIDGPVFIDTARRRVEALKKNWPDSGFRVVHRPFDESGGLEAMRAALEIGGGSFTPTAVTVASYNQLMGALAAVREAGVDVPAGLSLACYDDDPVLDYLDIKVTSVRMPLFDLGRAAMQTLRRRIDGEAVSNLEIGEPIELVERSSTGLAAPSPLTE